MKPPKKIPVNPESFWFTLIQKAMWISIVIYFIYSIYQVCQK